MAQYSTKRTSLRNDNDRLYEVQMQADRYGNIISPGASATSAFGEPISIPITPIIQADAVYGLDPDRFDEFTFGTGSVTAANSVFTLSTGTAQYGYGVKQTHRAVRYRPGQGALTRFTAGFRNPAAGYTTRAGFGNLENAIQIGYDGDRFGVLRLSGGKACIHRLNIATAAGAPSSQITITLNGTAYNLTIPSGTIAANSAYIGLQTFAGWNVEYHGNYITFQSQGTGFQAGEFSVTTTAGTFAGTMVLLQTGVAHTEYWTYQEDFNLDKLDGTGSSGMIIDPSKLNVYQINFRWLGAGEIRFAIEDSIDGNLIPFHHIHYANQHEVPHIDNPSMKIQYVAASVGGSGNDAQVYGASLMGAIEGITVPTKLSNAVGFVQTGLAANTYHHLITIRNDQVYNGKINFREILLKSISASVTSAASSPVRLVVYKGVDVLGTREYQDIGAFSTASYSTDELTITHDTSKVIYETTAIPGASVNIDVSDFRILMPAGETITIGVVGSNIITNATAALTWVED